MGELRRQQAAAELLGRQPRLGRPRRPAPGHGLHGPRPQRLPERLRARRRRRRHPEHGRGRLEGRGADHHGTAGRRPELLRLRALHRSPTSTLAAKQTEDDDSRSARASTRCRSTAPTSCRTPIKTQKVDPLDWLSADTDGDGIRDDQDDQDHDDVPNITEYLQEIATPVQGPQVPPARRLRPELRLALLPARQRRRRRRRDPEPRRHRRRRRRPARHARAVARHRSAARRQRQRRRLRRLRVLVRARPQRRRASLPGQGALPQRARRHRRQPGLRRRRPHPQAGVPGLELLRPAAAAELQRRQPVHAAAPPCATATRTSTATA